MSQRPKFAEWQKDIVKAMLQQQQAKKEKRKLFKVDEKGDVLPYVAGLPQTPLFKKSRPTSTEPSARLTELVGWRQWRLEDGKLWSVVANCCWEGPTLSAEKPAVDGEERVMAALFQPVLRPSVDPVIGIMAYKKASSTPFLLDPLFVLGSVYLWGSIAEHIDGYRAERATIRSLLVHPKAADQIEALQSRYQPEAIGIYRSLTDQLEAL